MSSSENTLGIIIAYGYYLFVLLSTFGVDSFKCNVVYTPKRFGLIMYCFNNKLK